MDVGSQAAGIGALADDTRRRLYEYVVAQPEPVGREQVGGALDLPSHKVSFHLDRLVAEGLLEVEFRRLTGRTGPGAGRPSKLYRRAAREFAVSLPARRYDVVGEILASAVSRARGGASVDESLEESAREHGVRTGRAAGGLPASTTTGEQLETLSDVLVSQGYESRVDEGIVVLANCPFDALARRHTALVCGLNRSYVQGLADGVGCAGATACLEPVPGRCCVTVRPAAD
jgi:predicted ArsR family transcriptional regulator